MSTPAPAPTAQDPNLNRPNPPEPDHLSSPSTANLPPPGPLLDSGSFIHVDPSATSASNTTAATTTTPSREQQPANPATSNGAAEPVLGPETTPRRRGASSSESWLPPGWAIEDRVRTSGATAGTVDKYYYHIASCRRFRSKKEVLYFLETGTKPKRKKGNSNADIDASQTRTPGSSGSNKQKKSRPRGKMSALNFDYLNAPEDIQWVLTDPSANSWTPFIGKDEVPESVRQDWASAFTHVTTSNGGYPLF